VSAAILHARDTRAATGDAQAQRSIGEGQGLAHLSLAFRFPRHTVTAKVINLIAT